MLNILRVELHRAFINRFFVVALGIGCLIAVSEIITFVLPVVELQSQARFFDDYPFSVYGAWIGGKTALFETELFYFLLPLLACIPFANSLHIDSQSGLVTNLVTRASPQDYFLSKSVAVFLSAGAVGAAPLLLNFLLTASLLPLLPPITTTGQYLPFAFMMWADLFYSQPYLYVVLYIGMAFLFSGLFALVALMLSFCMKNHFVVTLAPFIICLLFGFLMNGLQSITGITLLGTLSPIYFLNPLNICFEQTQYVILGEILLLVMAIISFIIYGIRRDRIS